MKILYLKLTNFAGVKAATGLNQIELDFTNTDKKIIQLYGKNRCGKTVIIQTLHPYSTINLNGDERSDLSLILPGEIGEKKIVYQIHDHVYTITHTYKPNAKSHTVSSSLLYDGEEELNPSGGVLTFNNKIEKLMGISKYTIQFIINGTQLTSIANMTDSQRKNLINKALGIDVYDKIHKLSTEDYRYTSKLITSLNQTREFLLSKYGNYDTMCGVLNSKRLEYDNIDKHLEKLNTTMSHLNGTIQTIQNQNVDMELMDINRKLQLHQSVVDLYGCSYSDNLYEQVVDEQIKTNNKINELNTEVMLLMKDLDNKYAKRNEIQNAKDCNNRNKLEYDNLIHVRNDIMQKLDDITIETKTSASSSYYLSLNSLAQAVNSASNEILKVLNDKYLNIFCNMIIDGLDIGNFIMKESSLFADSEKEKTAISRMQNIINTVQGDIPIDCNNEECFYKKAYNVLHTYFNSFNEVSDGEITREDIESLDLAYKSLQTIERLINIEIPSELAIEFNKCSIANNIKQRKYGIDVDKIRYFMEEAAKAETRTKYLERLESINKQIEIIDNTKNVMIDDSELGNINEDIQNINNQIVDIKQQISNQKNQLEALNIKRDKLSQIKSINVSELLSQQMKLTELSNKLNESKTKYQDCYNEYNMLKMNYTNLQKELEDLENDNRQYISTTADIEKYMIEDKKYKIIAEATSSTKGKPVIAIKEKIDEALGMTNRLLHVLYAESDNEIKMLPPVINENEFTLPFRSGTNKSPDIRFGSQSESTLLSLALSLSLASSIGAYNIPLVDEIDAYLDSAFRDNFLLMLQEIMSTLHMEQMFLISHSIIPSNYGYIIEEVNISDIVANQKD